MALPLTVVQAGTRVRLIAVHAGHGLRGRSAAMGLVPGVEIEVIRNLLHGPVLIAVGSNRISLGRGMADKIVTQ